MWWTITFWQQHYACNAYGKVLGCQKSTNNSRKTRSFLIIIMAIFCLNVFPQSVLKFLCEDSVFYLITSDFQNKPFQPWNPFRYNKWQWNILKIPHKKRSTMHKWLKRQSEIMTLLWRNYSKIRHFFKWKSTFSKARSTKKIYIYDLFGEYWKSNEKNPTKLLSI